MELLYKDLTGRILGIAMEIHRELGCGFLEALYQERLVLSEDLPVNLKNPRNPRFQTSRQQSL